MRKGCFLTIFILSIIIITGTVYFIKFHSDDLLNIGKDKIISLTREKVDEEIDSVEISDFKDSLKILVSDYIDSLGNYKPKDAMDKLNALSSNLKVILKDKKIDKNEFNFITKFMETDEKSKEDRN
ncbi:hypothetical protein BMS3Abin04_00283 [bacterium BMS3Abin04]|nr:hypothetical protein BMS3Abin04_00283 [bacterium BMS3Abin04]